MWALAGGGPGDCWGRPRAPGLGSVPVDEHYALRPDTAGGARSAFCCGRPAPSDVLLERHPAVRAGRWSIGAASALRAGLYTRALRTAASLARQRAWRSGHEPLEERTLCRRGG